MEAPIETAETQEPGNRPQVQASDICAGHWCPGRRVVAQDAADTLADGALMDAQALRLQLIWRVWLPRCFLYGNAGSGKDCFQRTYLSAGEDERPPDIDQTSTDQRSGRAGYNSLTSEHLPKSSFNTCQCLF